MSSEVCNWCAVKYALRVFSPAQSPRFTPDESTSNPPRRFPADFCRLSVVPPGIQLGIPEEAAMPNQVRVILGCWSDCRAGLPANCAWTWPVLLLPVPTIVSGRFRSLLLYSELHEPDSHQRPRG